MGKDKPSVWQEFADLAGGQVQRGRFLRPDKLVVMASGRPVTIDHHLEGASSDYSPGGSYTCTRFIAQYASRDKFKFSIEPQELLLKLAAKFGMPAVQVGHPEIDQRYVIRTNDDTRLQTLFANPRIPELILAQNRQLTLRAKGSGELRLEVQERITDTAELKSLFDLFREVMEQLCSASPA